MKYKLSAAPAPESGTIVVLTGKVDEGASPVFMELAKRVPPGPVLLDCDRVTYINSIGCSHWVAFLRLLDRKGKVHLANCREAVVTFANMVPQFLDRAEIVSFYFPYRCEDCDTAQEVLLERPPGAAPLTTASVARRDALCPQCGKSMKAEVDFEDYCVFLAD